MAFHLRKQARPYALPPIRLEHLWALLALSITGIFISLWPTSPNDFWWHLKAGEIISTSGIPTTNRFAWTLPADAPFVYQSWLGEWLFYAIYQLGNMPLVVFIRNILGLGAFTLVAVEAQRRSGSWRLAAGVTLLAAAMTINSMTTRTQNWSWIPFVVTLIILGRYAENRLAPRWLIVLPLLMIFWVNVHGAFMMGILVGGAFAAGETLRRLLRQPYALNWARLRLLYLAVVGMVAAVMINPLGVGVFSYVLDLLSDSPSQSLIIEWQSPTPRNLAGAFFYAGVLALITAFAFARRRPSITDVLLVCGLAWQAFVGVRYVVWFGMAAMPIVAQSLGKVRPAFQSSNADATPSASRRERSGSIGNWIVAALLVFMVVAVQPWFKPALPLPQPYKDLFTDLPGAPELASADTPAAATEHLRAEPCAGNLFNEMGYGSYMIWALSTEVQVFIDPRVELYPFALWEDYVSITRGVDVEQLLDKYSIACVMLDRVHQSQLVETMAETPGWQRTFAEGSSEVWRR